MGALVDIWSAGPGLVTTVDFHCGDVSTILCVVSTFWSDWGEKCQRYRRGGCGGRPQ